MENKRTYTIEINGIQESIDAVKVLNEQLNALDARIKNLDGAVKVNVGGSNSTQSLEEQDRLQKEMLATERKLAEVRDESYKKLLHMKEELREYTQIAKSQVAAEANSQGLFDTSTMAGIKAQLKSVKQEMQTVQIDGDRFKQLIAQANELNNKLKEIEQSYGQYGRNVGNYANGVAEGIEKLKIDVGGVIKEFDNAKQALMQLKKEMQTLSVKQEFGIISEEEAERLESLIPTVKKLESAVKDAGKPMDGLMDTMQGLVAIASTAQGIGALFGFDDNEIEQSIQKLVALQNVLQGLQTLQTQMQTNEGIGAWLSKGNAAADKLATSIVGVGKASKSASVATKALGTAFKALGVGLIVAAVTELLNLLETFTKKQNEAAEEAEKAAEKVKKAIDEQRNTFVGASATYMNTASRLSHLRTEYMTTNDELRKTSILKEASEEFKKLGISVNSVTDAQRILVDQGDKVIEMLRLQGDAAALAALRMEAFKKSFNMLLENGYDVQGAAILAGNSGLVSDLDKRMDDVNQRLGKLQKELGVNLKNGAKKVGRETQKAVVDAEALIAKARIDAMKGGFVKTMAELTLERNKRIAEAKKSGRLVQEQIAIINRQYQNQIFDARVEYHTNLINEEKEYSDKIAKLNEDRLKKEVENSKKLNELKKNERIDNAVDLSNDFQVNTLTIDYNSSDVKKYIEDVLKDYTNTRNTVEYLQTALSRIGKNYEYLPEKAKKMFDEYSKRLDEAKEQLKLIEAENEGISEVVKNIGILSEKTSEAYALRTQRRKEYYETLLQISQDAANKDLVIEKEKLDTEYDLLKKNEEKRHQLMTSRYYDDGENEAETERRNEIYKTPRDAFSAYMEEFEKGNVLTPNSDQFEAYFSDKRMLMDEWLDSFKKAVEEEKITWEEYNEFMNQEAIQGYLKAKTEYENFLTLYNEMSDEEKAKNEGDLEELTRNLNNSYVSYLDRIREEQVTHQNEMRILEIEYNNNVKDAEQNNLKERQAAYTEFYRNLLSETENVLSSVNSKIDKAEKKNAWGIINYSATKKELEDLEGTIKIALADIATQKEQLLERLKKGEISFGDYDTLISQLKVVETQTQDTLDDLDGKIDDLPKDWWETINQWIQVVGQAANQVLSSLSEISDNHYEAEIEKQEKYIEEYEKLLDKQKDITQEHADAVDSIENELSTARGDRRQQLIDQLNAEMAAQRASLAQEKKIEREKEKAEEKKKKLEHDQAVARKKMQLAQAVINAAMAVSMAAVNNWPIPAIPMMALAAATGAAQIAAIQSQNIPSYGSGGVIQGKSHREGGVKVLGGQAEVEGGEFITNKVTTSKNVDLLEYINTKRKKISLEDLIDFYGGNSQVKKSITTVRTKFADGGMIPTLRNDINLSDRMLTAFEDYSNRPVLVSVVDIIDRTQAVNDVRVMAGLE